LKKLISDIYQHYEKLKLHKGVLESGKKIILHTD